MIFNYSSGCISSLNFAHRSLERPISSYMMRKKLKQNTKVDQGHWASVADEKPNNNLLITGYDLEIDFPPLESKELSFDCLKKKSKVLDSIVKDSLQVQPVIQQNNRHSQQTKQLTSKSQRNRQTIKPKNRETFQQDKKHHGHTYRQFNNQNSYFKKERLAEKTSKQQLHSRQAYRKSNLAQSSGEWSHIGIGCGVKKHVSHNPILLKNRFSVLECTEIDSIHDFFPLSGESPSSKIPYNQFTKNLKKPNSFAKKHFNRKGQQVIGEGQEHRGRGEGQWHQGTGEGQGHKRRGEEQGHQGRGEGRGQQYIGERGSGITGGERVRGIWGQGRGTGATGEGRGTGAPGEERETWAPGGRGKGKEMCNANNFISSVQTLSLRC